MNKKQINQLRKNLPSNWRVRLQKIYKAHGKEVKKQQFTDFLNGKIGDSERLSEFLLHLNTVKQEYKKELNKIQSMICN